MIYDVRTYTIVPGKTGELMALYEREGYPVQTKYLGQPVGYFTSHIGDLNKIVHIWAYESLADREEKRARMQADPAWQSYLKSSAPYFLAQQNNIMNPASFFAAKKG